MYMYKYKLICKIHLLPISQNFQFYIFALNLIKVKSEIKKIITSLMSRLPIHLLIGGVGIGVGFLFFLAFTNVHITSGIKCHAGQSGSNFRVDWREYECNPKYHDRCYIAFCEYAGIFDIGYYRMGCANSTSCQDNQDHNVEYWRSFCEEMKGNEYLNKDFKRVKPCILCNHNLCNEPP